MKKLVSIILAVAMILSIGSVAMAEQKTALVKLTADFGDPACTWSIPDKFELTAPSFSDGQNVTIDSWKCELGKVWEIVADDASVTLVGDKALNAEASVSFTKITAAADDTDSSKTAPVTVSSSIDSISYQYPHLAGSLTFTGNLSFTLSYNDEN